MNSAQDVSGYLNQKYPGIHDFQVLKGGAWSAAYKFSTNAGDFIARVSATDLNFTKDQGAFDLAHEVLPVPRIVSIDQLGDKYICVSEYQQGDHFETLPAERLKIIKPSVIDLFENLHSVDIAHTIGYGRWGGGLVGAHKSWREFILSVSDDIDQKENLIHGWRVNLNNSELHRRQFEEIFAELKQRTDTLPEARHLVHSDLLNFNVLANVEKISAVLDWGSALFGDSLYDLAWFEFYEPWYPEFAKINLVEDIRAKMFEVDSAENQKERLLAYKLHITLDSMAYNAFKEDWQNFQLAYDRGVACLRNN